MPGRPRRIMIIQITLVILHPFLHSSQPHPILIKMCPCLCLFHQLLYSFLLDASLTRSLLSVTTWAQ
jgi:hypothetical protein